MVTIKWFAEPTQTHELSYMADSIKEIHHAFWTHGIPARIFKLQGLYVILYNCPLDEKGNTIKKPHMVGTDCRHLHGLTLKRWVELADKNVPDNVLRMEPGILWSDLLIKVKNSTL